MTGIITSIRMRSISPGAEAAKCLTTSWPSLYREDGAAVLFNEKLLDLHIEFVILRQQDLHTGQINGVGCVISHGGRGGIDGKGQCDMECRPGALPTGKTHLAV